MLLGAGGAALGWRWADPVVGLLITVAILFVLKDAAREVYRRLMDAVDPALVDQAETRAARRRRACAGSAQLRMRWIGHRLRAEAAIVVDADLTVGRPRHRRRRRARPHPRRAPADRRHRPRRPPHRQRPALSPRPPPQPLKRRTDVQGTEGVSN